MRLAPREIRALRKIQLVRKIQTPPRDVMRAAGKTRVSKARKRPQAAAAVVEPGVLSARAAAA